MSDAEPALDNPIATVPQDDIELYATGLYRARGEAAHRMALEHADNLRKLGDLEGDRVWRAVAAHVHRVGRRKTK